MSMRKFLLTAAVLAAVGSTAQAADVLVASYECDVADIGGAIYLNKAKVKLWDDPEANSRVPQQLSISVVYSSIDGKTFDRQKQYRSHRSDQYQTGMKYENGHRSVTWYGVHPEKSGYSIVGTFTLDGDEQHGTYRERVLINDKQMGVLVSHCHKLEGEVP
jgi:opacity protein-like surface antigen